MGRVLGHDWTQSVGREVTRAYIGACGDTIRSRDNGTRAEGRGGSTGGVWTECIHVLCTVSEERGREIRRGCGVGGGTEAYLWCKIIHTTVCTVLAHVQRSEYRLIRGPYGT